MNRIPIHGLAGLVALCAVFLSSSTLAAPHACIQGLGMENQQIWWTGSGNSKYLMDFTGGDPVLSVGGIGQTGSFEGTAVYTTPAGVLLLYTDGDSIFNGQTHALIGTGVGGDPSSTEAALIVPVPEGDPDNDFYVFGNNSNVSSNVINFTRVDLLAGTIGAIAPISGGAVYNESLAIVPHANGIDFWILTLTGSSPTLQAFLVDSTGVSNTPVSTAIPSLPPGTTANRGSIIYHPPTGQLAIGFYSNGTSTGYIYTAVFNETDGTANSLDQEVNNDVGYGVSFSPDASKIYYAQGTEGWSGTLYQKDLVSDVATLIQAGAWAMPRMAPDGRIYVVVSGATSMGVINSPDAAAASIDWQASGVVLPAGAVAAFSLPNQIYAACEVNTPPPPVEPGLPIPGLGAWGILLLIFAITLLGATALRSRQY
jgi:hypothetical protein